MPIVENRQCNWVATLVLALPLVGCGAGFLGETRSGPSLPGERISVMALGRNLVPDKLLAEMPVELPRPVENTDWPQPGGNARHLVGHPAINDLPIKRWSIDIGTGGNDDVSLLAAPLVAGGKLYTLDAVGLISAFDANTGERIWTADTSAPDEEDVVYSGAITTGGGMVFAATGAGFVIALDAVQGKEKWRVSTSGPIRGAPTYSDGRLFVTTIDNRAIALSASNGKRLWTHSGIAEIASLLGGASPAVRDNVVIVPYSSGEVFALKAETGRTFWVNSLSQIRRANAVASLADIRGSPVIDANLVLAISHSGRLSALDLKSGTRVWERRIAGVHTPWVAGKFIYIVSTNGEVICLIRRDGRIRWLTRLPRFESPEDREGLISYAGPLLAGDRLLVASSLGELHAISPYSGKPLGVVDVGGPIFVPPIIAGRTIYLLTDGALLIAYR